jgi:hypothetical protein
MTFAFRVCAFVVIAVACLIAWQWTAPSTDVTALAVQQFRDDGTVAAQLQEASAAQNWWPLVWPALIVLIGVVMFWDDAERWWKNDLV